MRRPDVQTDSAVLDWLLAGDPAIRWQVLQDLMDASAEAAAERRRIANEGWGAAFLARQKPDGRWDGIYTYKWTSTTYTLLTLRRLGLEPGNQQALAGCQILLDLGLYDDGGINFFASFMHSETCVTGMVLSVLAYFHLPDSRLGQLVEHLLRQQLPDGGWNCESYKGATHSSFHTTISVLEGLHAFAHWQPQEAERVLSAQERGREFLLAHRLYRSHRTGDIVHPTLTRFSFPPRWYYDVLRGLDYFQESQANRDPRLQDAIDLVYRRRKKDGCWTLQNRHSGRTYFEMEETGQPSRWNTLRALRVLRWWEAQ
jgi:hypothetical protein